MHIRLRKPSILSVKLVQPNSSGEEIEFGPVPDELPTGLFV